MLFRNKYVLIISLALLASGIVLWQFRPRPEPAPALSAPVFGDWESIQAQGHFQKPSDEELQTKLSRMSYLVTQHEATEQPFNNQYDRFYEDGIYVDIVSGEPLFSSKDKFDSGTGWPSFTKPMSDTYIVEKTDSTLGFTRTEIRSKLADSHLGHVFTDGPPDKGGLRYCMNSAALRFVPLDQMSQQGYSEYLSLFSSDSF